MIIDSSAILAVFLGEADAEAMAGAIANAPKRRISAANWLEASMVADRPGDPVTSARFDQLIAALEIEVVPVDAQVASLARVANQQFGRGNHPARLNFGDCMSYALAKARGEPLLFKGDDFSQTDIEPALRP